MLSKIKIFLAAGLGIAIAMIMAFRKGGKSAANEIKAETEASARDYQQEANKAILTGMEQEAKKRNEKIDTVNRDHFS